MSVNFKLLAGVLFSAGIIVAYFYIAYLEGKKPKGGNINEWSYKRFAQFYDKTEFNDPEFDQKIKTILRLINQEHVEDMFEIQDDDDGIVEGPHKVVNQNAKRVKSFGQAFSKGLRVKGRALAGRGTASHSARQRRPRRCTIKE